MANREIIPVIDLGPYLAGDPGATQRTAEEFHFALTEIGFYFIVNHGVASEQIHTAFREAARFHALPLEKKLEVKLDRHNVGYLPMPRRIDSFGPTAVELDDGTRRPRPDNQLRTDCRLHAPRLPERAATARSSADIT